jgi:hypothetical protein
MFQSKFHTWGVLGFVGNIVVIDVKDRGRLWMYKINIARWRLLEILFLDF